jgi:hypothetical protein
MRLTQPFGLGWYVAGRWPLAVLSICFAGIGVGGWLKTEILTQGRVRMTGAGGSGLGVGVARGLKPLVFGGQ